MALERVKPEYEIGEVSLLVLPSHVPDYPSAKPNVSLVVNVTSLLALENDSIFGMGAASNRSDHLSSEEGAIRAPDAILSIHMPELLPRQDQARRLVDHLGFVDLGKHVALEDQPIRFANCCPVISSHVRRPLQQGVRPPDGAMTMCEIGLDATVADSGARCWRATRSLASGIAS